MTCGERRYTYMTATTEHATRPLTLTEVQGILRPAVGTRYQLLARLGTGSEWGAYVAVDTRLRRKVVVRVCTQDAGDTSDLHERVQRARHAARLNAHLIAHIYDAVIDGDETRLAPPTTTAVIVCEYFEGMTLREAIDRGEQVDARAIITALTRRVLDAADAGVSFGVLDPANVVLTAAGPAIAKLPVGALSDVGVTSLAAVASEVRTTRLTRALRKARSASLRLAHAG